MKKNYLFLLLAMFLGTFSLNIMAQDEPSTGNDSQLNYCVPQDEFNNRNVNPGHYADRRILDLNVSAVGSESDQSPRLSYVSGYKNWDGVGQPNVYIDKTDLSMSANPGETLVLRWHSDDVNQQGMPAEWVHYYLYIDYNQDGDFLDEGELVSFTAFSEDGETNWVNSKGETASRQYPPVETGKAKNDFIMPDFEVPAIDGKNVKEGTTRMRFKSDWNSKDPCGSTVDKNEINVNGGTILDFTITIAKSQEPQPEVTTYTVSGSMEGATTETFIVGSGKADIPYAEVNYPQGTSFEATEAEGRKLYIQIDGGVNQFDRLVSLTVNGDDVKEQFLNDFKYVVDITSNINVVATFADPVVKHTVTFGQTGEGTLALADAEGKALESGVKVDDNAELTLTVTPAQGYKTSTVTIGGESQTVNAEGKYTFTVTANTMVEVVFVEDPTGIADEVAAQVSYDAASQVLNAPAEAQVRLYTATGAQVVETAGRVDLSVLPAGVYVAKVVLPAETVTIKVCK